MYRMKISWKSIVLRSLDVLLVLVFVVLLLLQFAGSLSFTAWFLDIHVKDATAPLFLMAVLWAIKRVILLLSYPAIARNQMAWYYTGLGLMAGAGLLLEITMSRVLAVAFFDHFALLILRTAVFGFGFAGVVVAMFPALERIKLDHLLTGFACCFAISAVAALKVVVEVPLQFGALHTEFIHGVYLAIFYLALAIPFFCAGMTIALLLWKIPAAVHTLYFSDLLGAGLGCLLVIVFIPAFGAPGTVIVAALCGLLAAACFGRSVGTHALIISVLLFIAIASLFPFRTTHFRVPVRENKDYSPFQKRRGEIEFTRWGPLSRVEVARFGQDKLLWINGGSRQALMKPFDGAVSQLPHNPLAGLVYALVPHPDVLIIGPAAGEEVLYALSYQPNSITNVEFNPVVCDIMQHEYRSFVGGIYNQANVSLINDEGRSYIRRSSKKFDIIQQINNVPPPSMAVGKLNISETYLLTVEAFHDYLDHLKPNGFVYIRRSGAIRLAVIAAQALRERGVEHPEEQMVIMSDPLNEFGGGKFYLKNGTFTEAELEVFRQDEYYRNVRYGPKALHVEDSKYYATYRELITTPQSWAGYYQKTGIDVTPVTDNRPFFHHFTRLSRLNAKPKQETEFMSVFERAIQAEYSRLAVLGEAGVLALIFVLLPLYLFKRSGLRGPGNVLSLCYFLLGGIGLVLIVIVFMQKFTLFMGNPTYSVIVTAAVLFLAAGCGSLLAGRLRQNVKGSLLAVILGIVVVCWLEMLFAPMVLNTFLRAAMAGRIVVAAALLFPLGVLLGMPLPLGLMVINRRSSRLIPWGWGIHAYAMVIGSTLSMILAVAFGFQVVIGVACVLYLGGLAAMLSLKVR